MSFKLADVKKEYEKNAQLRPEEVQELIKKIEQQPHLPQLKELQVILFLRSCNYQQQLALKTIDSYFTMRTRYSDIFNCTSNEVLKQSTSINFICVLPKKTEDGDIIMTMRLLNSQLKNYVCVEYVRLSMMILALHMHMHGSANGLILLIDAKNLTFGHVFKLSLTAIRRSLQFFQEALPVCAKNIHHINVNSAMEKFIALVKPFLQKKVADMIHCHSSFESLHKFVGKEYLPKDYEGSLPSIEVLHEQNVHNLFENLDFFKWHDSQKVDESKRVK